MISTGTLGQAIREMNDGPHDYTKDGKCSGCGNCCSNLLPMSAGEIADIRRYIAKNNIRPHSNIGSPLAKPIIDLTCPFLDTTRPKDKCMIYSHRPFICRVFMCNKKPWESDMTRKEYMRKRFAVDVRKTFFGDRQTKEDRRNENHQPRRVSGLPV